MRAEEIPNYDRLTDLEKRALAEKIIGSLRTPVASRLTLDRRWSTYVADPTNLSKEAFRNKSSDFFEI